MSEENLCVGAIKALHLGAVTRQDQALSEDGLHKLRVGPGKRFDDPTRKSNCEINLSSFLVCSYLLFMLLILAWTAVISLLNILFSLDLPLGVKLITYISACLLELD